MKDMLTMKPLPPRNAAKIVLFFVSFWSIGVVIGFWFGLGWFFLAETIRRFIMTVPQLYIPLLRLLLGEERAKEENDSLANRGVRLLYAWRSILLIVWGILTIIVFAKVNIKMVDIIQKIR